MPPAPFNIKRQYQRLGELLRPIDIESSLLFCNHVLAAWRGDESDPVIRNLVGQIRLPSAPFLVHLAARHCLLQSLGPSNRKMGTEDFKSLVGLLWEILDHDPAMEDPGWAQSDPTGWAIRYFGLQQRVIDILLQTYGLSVALFTHDMPRSSDESVDIPARVQEVLRMRPVVFMRAGFVAGALRMANIGLAPNLFYGTGIPVAILVFDKGRPKNKTDVLIIDASRDFEPGTNQNKLLPAHLDRILAAYDRYAEEPKCASASTTTTSPACGCLFPARRSSRQSRRPYERGLAGHRAHRLA